MSMAAALSLPLLLIGCLGWGAALLRLLGLLTTLRRAEVLAWSFTLGQGVWGWLMFWIGSSGHLDAPTVTGALLLGGLGTLFLRRPPQVRDADAAADSLHPLLIFAAVAFAAMLALEAVSPPTDTDSLAYHFALARDFAQAGRIYFIARAIDGAVPLMVQMLYASAFALGGETAMTAWAASLSAGMVLVFYAVSRIWLNRNWAAMTALAFATLPAVVYGAGSGQVEVKLGLVVIIGCLAVARAVETGCVRHAVAAGLAVGFFMASKYTGLLFAAATGLVLVAAPGRWRLAPAFTLAALTAGCQWYGWNWLHLGDPLFPALRPWLAPADPFVWPLEFQAWHKATWNEGEIVLSRTPWSLLAYPFLATFAPPKAMDAARVGLGFLPVALMPFAMAALWRRSDTVGSRLLWRMLACVLIFSVLWFFLGASQRVRHFLPVIPIFLLAAVVAGERLSRNQPARKALAGAFILAIGLQLAGQMLYVQRYASDWRTQRARNDRLTEAVSYAEVVRWINANLKGDVLVIHDFRFLNYLFTVPYYNAHPTNQALVDLSPGGDDPVRFHAGLCRTGGTHVLAIGGIEPEGADGSLLSHRLHQLVELGRAKPVASLPGHAVISRTLAEPGSVVRFGLFSLDCPGKSGTGMENPLKNRD